MNRVSGHYLSCIIEACELLGFPKGNECQSFALPQVNIEDPLQRFQDHYLLDLYKSASEHLSEPNIGLKVGSKFNISWLNQTGKLLPFCATLGEVGFMLGRYHRLTQSFGTSEVMLNDLGAWLLWHPQYEDSENYKHVIEAIFTGMIIATKWLLWNEHNPIKTVHFRHKAHGDVTAYEDILGCPVLFNQDNDVIGFDSSYLNFPLATSNPELKTEISRNLDRLLLRLEDESALIAQVEASIREQLHEKTPLIAETVRHLRLSERKLRYQLKRRSTNFRQIVNRVRREICDAEMRKNTRISLIAQKLGYHDQSAFNHAFHKWHGMSPRQYQANHSAARGAK